MKRSFCVALLFSGVALAAYAQDAPNRPRAEELPATADPAAADAAAADPTTPGAIDGTPDVGSEDVTPPAVDPTAADPAVDPLNPAAPEARPAIENPADDTDAVRPGEALEGTQPAEPGLPGSPPVVPDDAPPTRRNRDLDAPPAENLPDTILDTTPVPNNDAPPADAATSPGTEARNADGLGAPLVNEGTVPANPADDVPPPTNEAVPPNDALPSGVDRRLPIERQPLPPDAEFSEPLPADPDAFPPPSRRRPVIDPAYAPPAPPRPQPQIEIGEVVRNPVRVYETRLLVLMNHWPATEEALDVLARRFPTDARVPYLRFFYLSRTAQHDAALDALQKAVAMERLYPMTDYNRFMEPLQGPDRYYLERVRRASAELAAADGLVEPDPDDVLPENLRSAPPADRNTVEPPLPAARSETGRRDLGPPEIIDETAPPSRRLPREPSPAVDPNDVPPTDAAPAPGADTAPPPDTGGFDVEPQPGARNPGA